jgi:hypothetical protein
LGDSLKGTADLDWSDPAAKNQFLCEIVTDARRLLRLAGAALDGEGEVAIRESASLLEQLLLQDVVETPNDDGSTKATVREGTTKGRIPSATDPEQRHGRKSSSKRFNGHKGAVAADRESQIIVDVEVLEGSAPDATGALEQVERVEENTGQAVEETEGDCAYGGAETRQAFAAAGRELVAKAPQEGTNKGRFPKSAFELNLLEEKVTCPAGQSERVHAGGERGQGVPVRGGVRGVSAAGAVYGGERRANDLDAPDGEGTAGSSRVSGERGGEKAPAGAGGGGTSVGEAGAVGNGAGKIRRTREDAVSTAGAGDDREPAADVELGARAEGRGEGE